jgi:hypothetical protein
MRLIVVCEDGKLLVRIEKSSRGDEHEAERD